MAKVEKKNVQRKIIEHDGQGRKEKNMEEDHKALMAQAERKKNLEKDQDIPHRALMAKVESLMETQELDKKQNPKGSGIKALVDGDENELQKTQQCRSIKQGASLQSAPMETYY